MNYEEKYIELVGKIKKAYLYAQTDNTKAVLEEIFPELAESEDERIRKWIINEIKIKHHNLDEDNVDFVDKAMKANEAPEKIYIQPNAHDGWFMVNNLNNTLIEYTRTDAFIEKASEWLCYHFDKYIRVIGSSMYPAYSDLCRDFKNYMESKV